MHASGRTGLLIGHTVLVVSIRSSDVTIPNGRFVSSGKGVSRQVSPILHVVLIDEVAIAIAIAIAKST